MRLKFRAAGSIINTTRAAGQVHVHILVRYSLRKERFLKLCRPCPKSVIECCTRFHNTLAEQGAFLESAQVIIQEGQLFALFLEDVVPLGHSD